MKAIYIILCGLLMVGCSKPAPVSEVHLSKAPKVQYVIKQQAVVVLTPMYMDKLIRECITEKGYLFGTTKVIFRDGYYAVPQLTYIRSDFNPWFRQTMTALGVRDYDSSNDCDKHSQLYKLLLSYANFRAEDPPAESLAVGEVTYRPQGSRTMHTINIVIASDRLDIIYIEPQSGTEVFLSQAEKDSITLILF